MDFGVYKLALEGTQRLSGRRQKAAEVFNAVNAATAGVVAFLVRDASLDRIGLLEASLPLLLVGLASNFLRYHLIIRFKDLIGWRYEQLRLMESALGTVGVFNFP